MDAPRRIVVLAAVLAGALAAPGAASAKDTIISFQTPSHGIGCVYSVFDGRASIRCDVRDVAHPAPKPASCELDYGSAFGLGTTGRAQRLCVGDTVLNPKAKVIAYGRTRRLGSSFTCTSRTTGLRCTSRAGHGFVLSRARQRLF
jgi:hypothetical protein